MNEREKSARRKQIFVFIHCWTVDYASYGFHFFLLFIHTKICFTSAKHKTPENVMGETWRHKKKKLIEIRSSESSNTNKYLISYIYEEKKMNNNKKNNYKRWRKKIIRTKARFYKKKLKKRNVFSFYFLFFNIFVWENER